MNFEFISYEATPHERHEGIVSIKAYGKILLTYKVIKNTDHGYYVARPKIRNKKEIGEVYLPAFVIDSQIENEEIFKCVRDNLTL